MIDFRGNQAASRFERLVSGPRMCRVRMNAVGADVVETAALFARDYGKDQISAKDCDYLLQRGCNLDQCKR